MRLSPWVLLALLASLFQAAACTKTRPSPAGSPPAASSAPPSASSPEFDRKWSDLAANDVEAFYVEDDRGEGLMGNVRRTRHSQKLALLSSPPSPRPIDPNAPPQSLNPEQVQQVIRENLAGVRACYLRLSRAGDQRSGKAIVSFQIGAGGEVQNIRVEAPSFDGTSLPSCVSAIVSHWAFPKAVTGGLAISYPFVFVGG